ncbi:helix-turn-helix domain-containing protein [Bulleidia sp. zg-1006]|nr:helix-turn-helix transcriptional regulator [Bulleidia sp. zg-1006]
MSTTIENAIQTLLRQLRRVRIENGLTQKEMGEILNVSAQSVSAYENGTVRPDIEVLFRYMEYFQIPMAYFLREFSPELKEKPTALEMELLSAYRKSPLSIQQAIQLILFGNKIYKQPSFKKEAHLVHEKEEDYLPQD